MLNQITVAIMCYGLCGRGYNRSKIEIEGLTNYLYSCIDCIVKMHTSGRLSGVVFCGGFTNPDFPLESEAATTEEYFWVLAREHGLYPGLFPVLLEEKSCNTAQNIIFTGNFIRGNPNYFTAEELLEAVKENPSKAKVIKETIGQWRKLSPHIMFVCDMLRRQKVEMLLFYARMSMPKNFRLEARSFRRKDIHPNSTWCKQFLLTAGYLFDPELFRNDLRAGQ
ncbi:TPA: hypothetical protein DIV45_01450 [Patescibacteria group bacterium]|nr:hypothetical protein [Patescibacteria group bacterium]